MHETPINFLAGFFGGLASSVLLSPLDALRIQHQLNEKTLIDKQILSRAVIGCVSSQPAFWGMFWATRNLVRDKINKNLEPWVSSSIASTLCNPLFCFRTRICSQENLKHDVKTVWKGTMNLKDRWTRGLGLTYFHNVQFAFLVPLVEMMRNPEKDTASSTILKTAVGKIIVGTVWYPIEVFRTFKRMGQDKSIYEFAFSKEKGVFWRGYPIFLIRSVPQTAISLGTAMWLTG